MKQTLLLESVAGQTRLAVLEDGQTVELYYDRPDDRPLTGNLYVGRVQNVLKGMNAAFVDIGLDKNGFLAADDISIDTRSEAGLSDALKGIGHMLRAGQMILTQVVKEPGGSKGPRLSGHITLPGRLMVLLPDVRYVGISKKITQDEERARLYDIGHRLLDSGRNAGVILRTAAENAPEERIAQEYAALCGQAERLKEQASHTAKPGLIAADADIALRAVRDRLGENTEALVCDGEALYETVQGYARMLAPDRMDKIRAYTGEIPLFELHRVEAEARKIADRLVRLKSGGSLVIDETEALTVIDVNTARFTGNKAQQETLFKLNCEAADEIMRQLRLRDLGGIIIVDFIDMDAKAKREALLDRLRALAARDANRVNIAGMTTLGLVEMTRKKTRPSKRKQLTRACPLCKGEGVVPTYETEAYGQARDIARRRRSGDDSLLTVKASAPVIKLLKQIVTDENIVYQEEN